MTHVSDHYGYEGNGYSKYIVPLEKYNILSFKNNIRYKTFY